MKDFGDTLYDQFTSKVWAYGFGITTVEQYSFLYRNTQQLDTIFSREFRYFTLQEAHRKKKNLSKYLKSLVFVL